MIKRFIKLALLTALALGWLSACPSLERSFMKMGQNSFGADYLVVQYASTGQVIHCWKLLNTVITSERESDGIWWQDGVTKNVVHISGFYNYIGVANRNWDSATQYLKLKPETCL